MIAPQFLAAAASIDAEIQALDRRYVWARANDAPPKTLARIEAERNDAARRWGQAWGCRKVFP